MAVLLRFQNSKRWFVRLMLISWICVIGNTSICAKIYQYKDAQGVLHLTNTPRKSSKPSSVKTQPNKKVTIPKGAVYECSAQEIIKLIDLISLSEGVDPMLVRAVARAESGFNPKAVSPKGAIGVMQLMPDTAARFEVNDIFHPEQNIRGGIRYLKYLTGLFPDDVRLAVAAYNAGEGRVINTRRIPQITETVNYVDRVLQYYGRYKFNTVSRPITRYLDPNGHIHLTNM